MNRVLVLGGYGGFGARLSRRLLEDGWVVVIAGRSEEKARRFARLLPGAEGLKADRSGDLASVLAEARPDLLIDAAGPFQGSGYHVAEACFAAGVHYFDLSDAREFVCGFGALDERARKRGVVAITGVSTLPALSSAVSSELAGGMNRVDRVRMALSAAGATTSGRSVTDAVLSYAGQVVPVWRGQRMDHGIGAQELRRVRFEVEGMRPLVRKVALADVPDLGLLPDRLPGRPAVIFRAGNDSTVQMQILRLLAGLVRLGAVKSLRSLAGPLCWIQRRLSFLAHDCSAMSVEIDGWREGTVIRRRWTIIAEQGNGPEIPVLAAQLLARKLRDGVLQPGARDAGGLLSLNEFRRLFAPLALCDDHFERPMQSLYRRAMGKSYDRLPVPVGEMHDFAGDAGAAGRGTVRRGSSFLARFICLLLRFPPDGEYDVHVGFSEHEGVERWTRRFGRYSFSSELSTSRYGVCERFGPLRFHFELLTREGRLVMALRHWTVFGMPLPLLLAPRIEAFEAAEDEDFLFHVAVAMPVVGPVVHYRGTLLRL